MSDSPSKTDFRANVKEPEFGSRPPSEAAPQPKQNRSPSVLTAGNYFSGSEVPAAMFAAQILGDHPRYGRQRGEEFAARLREASSQIAGEQRLPAARWIEATIPFFLPDAYITGRCVVVGLALLSEQTLNILIADDFLAALAAEEQEGRDSVERRLIEEARRKLNELLRPAFSGSTATLSDLPESSAKDDALGRRAFADALAERIRSLRQTQGSSPLVILLDGPWGSGKSTILIRNARPTARIAVPRENLSVRRDSAGHSPGQQGGVLEPSAPHSEAGGRIRDGRREGAARCF